MTDHTLDNLLISLDWTLSKLDKLSRASALTPAEVNNLAFAKASYETALKERN